MNTFTRRHFLKAAGAAAVLTCCPLIASTAMPLMRRIPASGALIPALGMGTWITFNVGNHSGFRAIRAGILETFLSMGGRLVDSSPMYGSSEEVVGWAWQKLGKPDALMAATKTWTHSINEGKAQFQDSQRLWQRQQIELLQVHNLLNWQGHLPILRELKEQGLIRYLGVTTSHGRRHQELEHIINTQPLDFIQLTYNVLDREAEARLLPLVMDRGVAVIANRPLQGGRLFDRVTHTAIPPWAKELGINYWAQFFLKFILSHSAVTCAIPATSQVAHMRENMGALSGPFPDNTIRQKMVAFMEGL
ncbi:aldo/keto reductase [Aliiglaciecola sp. CAU 1673]|uniref:aldo/keto reductase n=1 Tax=Aliiglaciecola sp. CAU 1673 TaxID=3032595 RepID=UPI0023DC2419|nr:aldo/keto reductase [Aliiglaciecola sp. CAU 1673]MDF2178266.1 aldo/keto reductase [Aliiglaciecola sp. CAU 1673]